MLSRVDLGPVHEWMRRDHERLAAILDTACARGAVDLDAFEPFRAGLLRHVAIEEKVLLPAAAELRGGRRLDRARQLRLDHGALAAFLVPTPTVELVGRMRAVLDAHNAIEEGADGVYAECERLLGDRAEALLARMRAVPAPKLAPYQDVPRAFAAIERALRLAGRA